MTRQEKKEKLQKLKNFLDSEKMEILLCWDGSDFQGIDVYICIDCENENIYIEDSFHSLDLRQLK